MNNSLLFRENIFLKDLCTFGIGGCARFYQEVHSIDEMQRVIIECKLQKIPFFILGKGSNCLFDDKGFQGLVIQNKIQFFSEPSPGIFHVGAGYSFSLLGTQTSRQGWSGLEFASGIPASVGGAIFMNAGANGYETCQSLVGIDFVDVEGNLHSLSAKNLQFSYRTSPFQAMPGAIVAATFSLTKEPLARRKQLEIIQYRTSTQPYNQKSAGCVFRNPPSTYAGALIEQCGLKNISCGGAKVSEMHANFIINTGTATAVDVKALISLIQQRVAEQMHIELEPEIRSIPYQLEIFYE